MNSKFRGIFAFSKRAKGFWKSFCRNKLGLVGLLTVSSFVTIALLAPWLAPHDPFELGEPLRPPNYKNLMGTDDLGRDIFSQFLFGARASLLVGVLAAGLSSIIGVFVGAFSGYYGGKIDEVVMRITEGFQILPPFILALVVIALFGSSILMIILVIGIFTWPVTARLTRGQFLSLKENEYVSAARSIGAGDVDMILDEILPNALPPIIVNSTLQIARAISMEASLSFLGLGDLTVMSWGRMINAAILTFHQGWWTAFFPGLAIFLTVLGFNILGDGLNDALNPRLREQ
jgi:peptide/nickel transport system permease protein